ncbi:MAG TPA: hypothetical protein VF638_00920 [Sphingomonas sp.]|jgi:hypothetical protein
MSMTEDEFEQIVVLREREFQAMGAAISNRNWHDVEVAYSAGRDRLDGVLNDAKRWSWMLAQRAAQGIEARSDTTRSGVAEGESPVPQGCATQDTPNPEHSHV